MQIEVIFGNIFEVMGYGSGEGRVNGRVREIVCEGEKILKRRRGGNCIMKYNILFRCGGAGNANRSNIRRGTWVTKLAIGMRLFIL